jgi:CRP-like cAMP-binding protein
VSSVLPPSPPFVKTTLVLSTFSEARAIVHPASNSPGPISIITFDRLFGGLDDLPSFDVHHSNSGQRIACRGKVPDRVFVIVKGIAMLETSAAEPSEYTGRILQHAELVGLVEMLAERPLSYDVTASTDCEFRSISREDLLLYLATHPEARTRAIRLLADFVRDADRLLKRL